MGGKKKGGGGKAKGKGAAAPEGEDIEAKIGERDAQLDQSVQSDLR